MAFESLTDKLSAAFKKLRSKGRLTERDIKESMREIKLALLEADVNFKVVRDFVSKVSERAVGTEVLEGLNPAQQIVKIVNEEICALMGSEGEKLNISPKPPTLVMFVGLGIGQGFQPVASFNYQAKKYRRVKKGLIFSKKFIYIFLSFI